MVSTVSGGSRISMYTTCIKKLTFAIFVMFLAESLGDLTCSIEKSFHFLWFIAGKKNAFVGVGLVGLVHCKSDGKQTNKPDLFLLILSLALKLLTFQRYCHICISAELAIKGQNSLPGRCRAGWE